MLDPLLTVAVTAAVTATVSGVVTAIVATAINRTKAHTAKEQAKEKQREAENKAMKNGMRALLWRELKEFHDEAVDKNGMTKEQREHLHGVYASYHTLGGNGTGTKLHDEAMELPVL